MDIFYTVLFCFSCFHSYLLTFFLSFIAFAFFSFFFEDFSLANLSKMIPASICQVCVTRVTSLSIFLEHLLITCYLFQCIFSSFLSGGLKRWRIRIDQCTRDSWTSLCKLSLCPTLYNHQEESIWSTLFFKNDTASYIRE